MTKTYKGHDLKGVPRSTVAKRVREQGMTVEEAIAAKPLTKSACGKQGSLKSNWRGMPDGWLRVGRNGW
jgi:hypothetical protein